MANMNMGEGFIGWTQDLIESSYIRVTAGTISDRFCASSEVRQGCPLSPLIFDIGIEPLARALRKRLRGIDLGDHNSKVSLYADDTEILAKDSEDLETARLTLTEFESQSAMKVNVTKSSILDLGKEWIPRGSWGIPCVNMDRYLGI